MFLPLFLAFTLLPALEVYFLFKIGSLMGGFNTFIFIIFTGALGAYLAKIEGRMILAKIQNELNRGEIPSSSIIHGLLIFAGGLLLLTPGFITDFLGFSFVLPGSRHFLVTIAKSLFEKAIKNGNVQFYGSFNGMNMGGFKSSPHSHSTDNSHQSQGPKKVGPDTFEAEFERK